MKRKLINDFIRDCIADIKFCRKCIAADMHVDENEHYLEERINDLNKAFKARHAPKFNRFGYPILEED